MCQSANLQMVATVIYWVVRAAMARTIPGAPLHTLHAGDLKLKSRLVPDDDDEQQLVLAELWRIGWMDQHIALLQDVVDSIWKQAVEFQSGTIVGSVN